MFFFTPFTTNHYSTTTTCLYCSRSRCMCAHTVFTLVCLCVLTAHVRARQCSFIVFNSFFLFRCESLCAHCACVFQSTCVCTYVRYACVLSNQTLHVRVCVLTDCPRARASMFFYCVCVFFNFILLFFFISLRMSLCSLCARASIHVRVYVCVMCVRAV